MRTLFSRNMRRVRPVLILLLAYLSATAAPAADNRRQAALALIPIPWQQLHYDIVFLSPRRGFRAMTFESKRRIEIYARPQDDLRLIAFDIAHELGHAIDLTYNTEETRKKWMKLRGIDPATSWFGCNRCTDYATPAGDFAETFALLLRGPEHFRGVIAARPTAAQLPALMALLPQQFVSAAESANNAK